MLVAKSFAYDTCAIAGFDKTTILKNLGVKDENIKLVLAIAFGKALDEGYDSYRYDVSDITTFY